MGPRRPKGFGMCAQNWPFMCVYVFSLSIHQKLHLSWRYPPSFIYLQRDWRLNWSLFQSCTECKNSEKQFGANTHPFSKRKVVLHRDLEPWSSDLLLENNVKFIGNPPIPFLDWCGHFVRSDHETKPDISFLNYIIPWKTIVNWNISI